MKTVKIIGVVGSQGLPASNSTQSGTGVGKDTVSDLIGKIYGYQNIKFASDLRRMFYEDFGLPGEKKGNKVFEFSLPSKEYCLNTESPRFSILYEGAMETLSFKSNINESMIKYAGILRKNDNNIFVISTLRNIQSIVQNTKKDCVKIILSDMRQFNEFQLMKSMNGTQIEIWRNHAWRERQALDCQLLSFTDLAIHNNRTIESMVSYLKSDSFKNKESQFKETTEVQIEYLLRGYENVFPFNSQN